MAAEKQFETKVKKWFEEEKTIDKQNLVVR